MDASSGGDFAVHCVGIDAEGVFLRRHTGRGNDESPGFRLFNVDGRGRSICIVLTDMTHPVFGQMTHWLAWNLPVAEVIPPGITPGARSSRTGIVQGLAYGVHQYRGPKPPKGTTHDYRFTLYVLDRMIERSPRTRAKNLLSTIAPFVLQTASVTGRFE